MNSEQSFKYHISFPSLTAVEKSAEKLNAKVVCKKVHTKVFNKKLGCYVDDYPLDKYLIKNYHKIIYYTQIKENLYAIVVEKSLLD